jgi:hypothetical protein
MTITKNKTISFTDLMKVFKKYVSGSSVRPTLQLVSFDGEYFTGTDSHVLLRVNKNYVSDIPENVLAGSLINPIDNTINTEGHNYPETSRLIPNHSNTTVELNKSSLNDLQKTIKCSGQSMNGKQNKSKVIKLEFTYDGVTVFSDNHLEKDIANKVSKGQHDIEGLHTIIDYRKSLTNISVSGEELKIHASCKYLNDALITIKKLSKLSNGNAEICLMGKMRPIQFKQNGFFDLLVLPIRKY